MRRWGVFLLLGLFCVALIGSPGSVSAATYTSIKPFDPAYPIYWDYVWEQCVLDLPTGAPVEAVQVEVKMKVGDWGHFPNPTRIDLLCSDTTTFSASDPAYSVCSFTLSTHPNPLIFYTQTCTLRQNQISWLTNNKCINFKLVVNGGTFYLDYVKVTATAPKVATPTFSPAAGTYSSPQSVTISCTTQGATVRYTLDGNEPTESSTTYTAPVQITATKTLKAKAFKTGWTPSDTASATYTLKAAAPTFSPAAGTYSSPQSVTISCTTQGATVRYTLDGNEPTENSTTYTAPVQITATKTLEAKAFKTGWTPSDTALGTYTIEPGRAAMPWLQLLLE